MKAPAWLPSRALARLGLPAWIEILVVVGSCAAVFIWLGPSDIFTNNTPTGGDMGAHVWGPAFLRDELLSNWQIRGWSTSWYAGFPAFQFYMVLPYLVIVAVDVLLPYGVAFKLVAVSGVVLMPAAGWAMARLARWEKPLPELCAAAMLLFVFQVNFTIYGGNIASTLAGEFAFAMGLSAALVYIGLLLRSLETGLGRARTTIALAVVTLLHPIPLIFAVAVSVIAVAVRALHRLPEMVGRTNAIQVIVFAVFLQVAIWNLTDSVIMRLGVLAALVAGLLVLEFRRSWWVLTIGAAGGALSAFWSFPFVARRSFLNDMGWEKISDVRTSLFFPNEATGDAVRHSITWLLFLAAIAVVVGLVRWQRSSLMLTAIAVTMGMAFVHWPQHRLWNARILPFWYLIIYFLAAVGLWILIKAFANTLGNSVAVNATGRAGKGYRPVEFQRISRNVAERVNLLAPLAVGLAALIFTALYLGILPGQRYSDGEYQWGPLVVDQSDRNFVQGWASYNFTGYEQRAGFTTYTSLIDALQGVGNDHGCGSVLWEYGPDELGSYGTPMAPMLLPYWTDGCIASMEGLYFESSPTVPFHFLMQSELSLRPSRAMRDLPYRDLDLDLGVAHMQLSGVRYYAAFTTEALTEAEKSPELTPVAYADPWVIYRVGNSELVQPLSYEPAVAVDAPQAGRAWTDPAVVWFNDRSSWDVLIAADGPDEWERVQMQPSLYEQGGVPSGEQGSEISATFTRFGEVAPEQRRALPAVTVSAVDQSEDGLSFEVDRVGVPVLVKVSYFPNWRVQGAAGPYRVTPNWMVVVPTEQSVQLQFGATGVEYIAWLLSLAGLLSLAYMALRLPVRFDKSSPGLAGLASTGLASTGLASADLAGTGLASTGLASADLAGTGLAGLASTGLAGLPTTESQSSGSQASGSQLSGPQATGPQLFGSQSPRVQSPLVPGARKMPVAETISVVLPAYQAAQQVGEAVREIRASLAEQASNLEIIVVDDGSTDDTALNAAAAGADRVIIFGTNRGKGAAVREGMLAASGDIRIFTDVDLSYPPSQFEALIEKLNQGADVVVGNRRHSDTVRLNTGSNARAVGSRLFNLAARVVLLGNYRDTQCGLKGFTAHAAQSIFSRCFVDGFAFDVEVLYLAEISQIQVTDVPVTIRHEADSTVQLVPQAFAMLSSFRGIRRRVAKGVYEAQADPRVLVSASNGEPI